MRNVLHQTLIAGTDFRKDKQAINIAEAVYKEMVDYTTQLAGRKTRNIWRMYIYIMPDGDILYNDERIKMPTLMHLIDAGVIVCIGIGVHQGSPAIEFGLNRDSPKNAEIKQYIPIIKNQH